MRRGKLKVFLGYAAGVGKTYRMLQEARDLRLKGADAIIGYFEPHGRQETIALTEGFETVPRRTIAYARTEFEEMDTPAILRRRPAVAVVDEFAHTNIPGAGHAKRWQDVGDLLDAGIDVLTTLNVQHLESLNDQVWELTGVRVRETVPDWVLDDAAEVVMVDLTPRALRNRLERGVVYSPDKAQKALDNFFSETNLSALREMAMRHTAHEVEERLSAPLASRHPGGPVERILVCLTGRPSSAMLIRRARRVADYLQADCLALHVAAQAPPDPPVERHLSFARNLRIDAHVLTSGDVPQAITTFARSYSVSPSLGGGPLRKRSSSALSARLMTWKSPSSPNAAVDRRAQPAAAAPNGNVETGLPIRIQ
jgi:two-component system sensor histidine kinase KdpD